MQETPITKSLDYNIGYSEGFLFSRFREPLTVIQESLLKERDHFREREAKQKMRKLVVVDRGDYGAGAF